MLARDVREAGGKPCTRNIVNMLDTSKPGGNYYLGWTDGLSGVDGTGPNSSDEITLYLANGASIDVTRNEETSANLGGRSPTGLVDNAILMVSNDQTAGPTQEEGRRRSRAGGEREGK